MNRTGRFVLTLTLTAMALALVPGEDTLTAQPTPPERRPGKVYIKHELNQGKAALGIMAEEPVAGPARDAVLRARVPILRDARPSPRRHVDPAALYERRLAMYGESAAFDKGLPRTASEEGDPDGGRARRSRSASTTPEDSSGFPWAFFLVLTATTTGLVLLIRMAGATRRRP
jgi:hypothetical protein